MKGIILAGGSGTRLYPLTQAVCKQLLPIYDKPMIYYPLSTLMLAGIREVLIISTPRDLPRFQELFGDGSQLGMSFSYVEQPSPDGLAQSFILGEEFIGDDDVCLILGDNLFYGDGLPQKLSESVKITNQAKVAQFYAYYVSNPSEYGVVEFDDNFAPIAIEEKPKNPKSNYAITGLYFYPNDVVDKAKKIKPSSRGELEITSVNNLFIQEKRVGVVRFGRGYTWLDAGTHATLLESGQFIETIEKRQGLKVACVEEIAYKMGYIDCKQLKKITELQKKNAYSSYLLGIVGECFE